MEGVQVVKATREIVSAEVDVQIATANRFPRNVDDFQDKLTTLAAMNQPVAESCFYALPRRTKDGGTKHIVGPSIRFAEILTTAWKNLRVGSRVTEVHVLPKWHASDKWGHVTVEAACHDLESNVVWTKEYRQKIEVDPKKGGVELATNSAQSRCARNAVLAAVPRALWQPVLDGEVKKCAAGTDEGIAERRAKALELYAAQGIPKERIAAHFRRQSAGELTSDDLLTLRTIWKSWRDGALESLEEAFPKPEKKKGDADKTDPPGEGSFLDRAAEAMSGDDEKPAEAEAPAEKPAEPEKPAEEPAKEDKPAGDGKKASGETMRVIKSGTKAELVGLAEQMGQEIPGDAWFAALEAMSWGDEVSLEEQTVKDLRKFLQACVDEVEKSS